MGGVYLLVDLVCVCKCFNDLGIFLFVCFVEGEVVGFDGVLLIIIEVSECKWYVIGVGVFWLSIEGFGLEVYWWWWNLFGGGEFLFVEGFVGWIGMESLSN